LRVSSSQRRKPPSRAPRCKGSGMFGSVSSMKSTGATARRAANSRVQAASRKASAADGASANSKARTSPIRSASALTPWYDRSLSM